MHFHMCYAYEDFERQRKSLFKAIILDHSIASDTEKEIFQVKFITNLRKIVESGEKRALLISATGAHIILMTGRKALI